jgi:hypothetical protein
VIQPAFTPEMARFIRSFASISEAPSEVAMGGKSDEDHCPISKAHLDLPLFQTDALTRCLLEISPPLPEKDTFPDRNELPVRDTELSRARAGYRMRVLPPLAYRGHVSVAWPTAFRIVGRIHGRSMRKRAGRLKRSLRWNGPTCRAAYRDFVRRRNRKVDERAGMKSVIVTGRKSFAPCDQANGCPERDEQRRRA